MVSNKNSAGAVTDAFEQAYDTFIRRISRDEQVWALFSEQESGWAVCPSAAFEDTDVLPFWSTERGAAALCTEAWRIYSPKAISLDEFIHDWLPGMHEDDALVGPDWDVELEGLEVEPADMAAELEAELSEAVKAAVAEPKDRSC